MKQIYLLPFFLLLAFQAVAQLFTNASANLPNNGAMGASMDVRAADLDGDGDMDIVLANEFQANTILLNDGAGHFTNGTAGKLPQEIHDSEDVAIADYDNDGDPDLVFCSEDDINLGWANVHEIYLNDGTGSFTAASYQVPDSESNAVIATDLNADGFPDLLFGNKGFNAALINNADGTGFTAENDRVPQVNRTTQDLALADVDGDSDLDLFEGNENGNLLHLNDGMGHFTNVTDTHLPQGLNLETRKATFGDVDADGDLDLFLSNVLFIPGKDPQNRLFLNDGTGHFTDATAAQLPTDSDHTIDAIFEDCDLDGDLDIVVANVFGAPIKLYENNGAGFFTDSTLAVFGTEYVRDALGVIAADLNGDGFRDLYICDRHDPQNSKKDLLLLRNPVISSVHSRQTESIALYPNPVGSYFFLQTKLAKLDSVLLENRQGQLLGSLSPQPQGAGLFRCELGAMDLPTGLYFVRLVANGVTVGRKTIFR